MGVVWVWLGAGIQPRACLLAGCLELLFYCLLLLLEPTKDQLLSITAVPLLIVRYNSSQQLIFELDIFSGAR